MLWGCAGGNVSSSILWKTVCRFLIKVITVLIQPSRFTFCYLPTGHKNIHSRVYMHTVIYLYCAVLSTNE